VIAAALQKGQLVFVAIRNGEEVGAVFCAVTECQGKQALHIELLMADGDVTRRALVEQASVLQKGLGLDLLTIPLSGPAEIATYTRLNLGIQPLTITCGVTVQEKEQNEQKRQRKQRRDSAAGVKPIPAPAEQSEPAAPVPDVQEQEGEPLVDPLDIKPATTVALSDHSRYPGRSDRWTAGDDDTNNE